MMGCSAGDDESLITKARARGDDFEGFLDGADASHRTGVDA